MAPEITLVARLAASATDFRRGRRPAAPRGDRRARPAVAGTRWRSPARGSPPRSSPPPTVPPGRRRWTTSRCPTPGSSTARRWPWRPAGSSPRGSCGSPGRCWRGPRSRRTPSGSRCSARSSRKGTPCRCCPATSSPRRARTRSPPGGGSRARWGRAWTSELLTVAEVEPAGAVAVRPSTVVGWAGGATTGDVPPTVADGRRRRPRRDVGAAGTGQAGAGGAAAADGRVRARRVGAGGAGAPGRQAGAFRLHGRSADQPAGAACRTRSGDGRRGPGRWRRRSNRYGRRRAGRRRARRRHRGPGRQHRRRAPPRRVARAHLRPPGAAWNASAARPGSVC